MSAAGCGSNASSSQIAAPAPAAPADAPAPPKKLTLTSPTNTKFVAGTEVIATAEGLPPNQQVDAICDNLMAAVSVILHNG